MSITIRLSRYGRKNAPSFRVVVAETKSKRDGKYIDKIGVYNPSANPVLLDLDKSKYEEWVKKGALVTPSVKELVAGTYVFKPYRKAAKGQSAETENQNEEAAE